MYHFLRVLQITTYPSLTKNVIFILIEFVDFGILYQLLTLVYLQTLSKDLSRITSGLQTSAPLIHTNFIISVHVVVVLTINLQ